MPDTESVPSVGRFEDAHGRQAELGQTKCFVAVPDGVRPAPPVSAAPSPLRKSGRFTAGPNGSGTAAAKRKSSLAKVPDFVRTELDFVPAEDFAPFDQARRDILSGKCQRSPSWSHARSAKRIHVWSA